MNGLTEGARSHLANAIQGLSLTPPLSEEDQMALRRMREALVKLDAALEIVRELKGRYEDPEYAQLMELLS